MNCIYSNSPRFLKDTSCSHKRKYGEYCYKHRKLYLLDSENIITKDVFTYLIKDYKIIDLLNTLKKLLPNRKWNKTKKITLFNEYVKYINGYRHDKIVTIQKHSRRWLTNFNIIKGPSYFMNNISKNDEDFYFMDNVDEINRDYIFSYKDDLNNVWSFDIRSFKKLINSNKLNPYTRETITNKTIANANTLINRLEKYKIDTNIKNDIIDRENVSKQKIVDICSTLSEFGYYCDINWFLSLELHDLKKLYKELEDIWRFRAFLNDETRSRISPPNGLVFNIRLRDIFNYTNIDDLRETILNEILKFNNAITIDDKKIGYMFYLIGLSQVNIDCLNSHEWIQFAI